MADTPETTTPPLTLKKLFTKDQQWETEEMKTVMHWLKQIIAVLIGLVFGCFNVTGYLGVVGFFFVVYIIVNSYLKYLNIDEDDLGGRWSLLQEGLSSAFGIFMLCWVMMYTYTQTSA